ncbi:hypothetical protein [Hydrogenophaga sp. IBVHS2]|uniref:hypothetical protein n=1 Tax=Hydrogenophaga sp. IBVHS2 TaxID=1985170 RepID=UPI00117998E5|nr:hypothetical protein [Hydrogenophaga sp. IBVHS2]
MKDKLIDIQQGILDVQSKLADATEERLNLLGELAELKQKMRDLEASQAALDSYELHAVAPGQFLYKSKPESHEVDHYACPQCFGSGKVNVLQSKKTGREQISYSCFTPSCRFQMAVGPNDPPMPLRRTRNWAV